MGYKRSTRFRRQLCNLRFQSDYGGEIRETGGGALLTASGNYENHSRQLLKPILDKHIDFCRMLSIIDSSMITMECQPGGHGGHLGHSMLMDPTTTIHQQEQDHKKKRDGGSHVGSSTDGKCDKLTTILK
ncbi:hypothetical protein ABEB36_000424 [Hypothenemus hampei]|uniref:Uncharacterized protein n=1 Tax=Hypothenemus hampei TaxID=57062 RepID=A0ABD1FB86_HYPHA